MPRVLLLAALAALLASAASAADVKCRPGCDACVALTGDELAAYQKAKAEMKAQHEKMWEDKKKAFAERAAKDPAFAAKAAKWADKVAEAKKDGKWGKWEDRTPTKCTKCAANYELTKEGWCMCPAGSGLVLPADGSRPAHGTTLECKQCADGFASGPDAPRPPKPTWAGEKGKGKANRNLLGADFGGMGRGGKGPWHAPPICVKCPNGSNDDHTKCL